MLCYEEMNMVISGFKPNFGFHLCICEVFMAFGFGVVPHVDEVTMAAMYLYV